MMCAAFGYRVPPEGWKPKGWVPPSEDKQKSMITQNHVHIDEALKTPQFYFLWQSLVQFMEASQRPQKPHQ